MGAERRAVYHEAIRKEQYPTVTQSQIDSILRPFQTVQERNLHLDSNNKIVWLQTRYEPGTDSLHDQLIASLLHPIEECTDGEDDECLLDDPDLYDFGDDWSRIFRRLPELVKGDHKFFNETKNDIRDAHFEAVRFSQEFGNEVFRGPDYSYVHIGCQTSRLFVEDAEALRTRSPLVVWLDDCGRLVRQGRCPADELRDLSALELSGAVYDCFQPWMDGEIGVDYRDGRLPFSFDPPVPPTVSGLES